jgi:hypothetical protein
MTIVFGASMIPTEKEQSLSNIKEQVAKILLDHADGKRNGHNQLAQRDIASMLGANWLDVHQSLRSLYDEGTIKIEGCRIILNKDLIMKAAGEASRANQRY